MPVEIAENINDNIDNNERDKLNLFNDNPGFGGQHIRVRIAHTLVSVSHVTYGKGSGHVSVFYNRDGETFRIVGVGHHTRKKGGKTTYSAYWEGHDARQVTVQIQ